MKKHSSKKFIVDVLFSAIPPFVSKFASFIFLPLITKLLSSLAYGVWQQFNATTTLLLRFSSINVGTGLKKYLSKDVSHQEIEKELSSVTAFVLILSTTIGGLIIWQSSALSKVIFDSLEYQKIVVLLGLLVPIETLLNNYNDFLRSQRYNKILSILNSLRHVVKMGVLCLSIVLIRQIEWVILAFVLVEVVWLLYYVYRIHIYNSFAFSWPDFSLVRKYIVFGFPLLFASMGIWLTTLSDRYLILHFLDLKQVGIYSAAYVLGSIPLLLIKPLTQVLLPDFSLLVSNNDLETLEKRMNTLLKYYLAGVFFFILINLLFADVFLLALSTKEFSDGILVVKIVTIGISIYGFMKLLNSILSAIEKKSNFGFVWVIIGISNVLLNLILIPRFQLLGAALSILICYSLGSLVFIYLITQKVALKVSKELLKIGAAAITIFLLGIGLENMFTFSFFFALLLSFLFVVLYLLLLHQMNFFSKEEQQLIRRLKSKIL